MVVGRASVGVARWWYFIAVYLVLILPVYPWSRLSTSKQTYFKMYKSVKIASSIIPRCHRQYIYMTNDGNGYAGEENDEDVRNEDSNDEDYEIFESTPDFVKLGHNVVSATYDRVDVLFIKLVMARSKDKYYMNNKVTDHNYLEDSYKKFFYYSTIENGINGSNKKNINNFVSFINEFLSMSSMKISSYQQSDINPLLSGEIDHIIDPRNIGLSLIEEVVQDLITSLQLIIKENAECVRYAALYIQEGVFVATKDRKSIFTSVTSARVNADAIDKSNIDSFVSTYKLLNIFVTNCALDNIKNQLLLDNMPVISKWLDDFIQDVAAVDTLNSIISSRAPIRSKINKYTIYNKQSLISPLDDMYDEGTPRDLVERLVLNGLMSLVDEKANKLYKQSNANPNMNSSPTRLFQDSEYIGDTSIPKVIKDPDEDDVDLSALNSSEFNWQSKNSINANNQNKIKELEVINNLGQSLVDGRAASASEVLSNIVRIKDSFKLQFNDEIRAIESKDVLSSLNLQYIAALSPSIEVNAYKYQVEINNNSTDNTTISNSRVTSGGTAGGNGNADNSLDSLSSAGITNKVGWKSYEDSSQTKVDPSGVRIKPSVGVIDPPNNEKPPKYTDRGSNDNVIEDTRNNVDYGDIDLGSIDEFNNLGRNARIRLIGDKIDDDGRRILCLEVLSDTISLQNPFKRWVMYEEAMILLGVITDANNANNANNDSDDHEDTDKDIFSYYSQVLPM